MGLRAIGETASRDSTATNSARHASIGPEGGGHGEFKVQIEQYLSTLTRFVIGDMRDGGGLATSYWAFRLGTTILEYKIVRPSPEIAKSRSDGSLSGGAATARSLPVRQSRTRIDGLASASQAT